MVAATRSPIGRAGKGSMVDLRPDDLAASMVAAAVAQLRELDAAEFEDLILGCGQPAGEQGYNLARVVAILAGLPNVPGLTVNRYCSSSLAAIRIAGHAIKAGEGNAFIAAGVECVSRFGVGRADGAAGSHNPRFGAAQARSAERCLGDGPAWAPVEGLPDIYVAMGQTAENVAELADVSRLDMDAFAALSQQRAGAAQDSGFFAREITPVTLPDGRIIDRDDCPRPTTTAEKLADLKPVFRPA